MAKKTKKNDENGEATKKRKAPPSPKKPDYGVEQLAEHMEITPFTVRGKLRAAGIKKDGRTYDFGNQSGIESTAKELRSKEKPKKEKADKTEKKPKKAKKGKKSKTAEE